MSNKAFGYIRVSTLDQKGKSGPDRQEESIRRCAQKLNLTLTTIYREDVSGATLCVDRPVFAEMLDNLNGTKYIIVEDLSRLARSVLVHEQTIIQLAASGVDLICGDSCENVTEIYREDDFKAACIKVGSVFVELERKRIVRRLQAGRHKSGRLGGRPPHYPRELREKIRNLRAEGQSYGEIADLLNEEGEFPTTTGKLWTPQMARAISLVQSDK